MLVARGVERDGSFYAGPFMPARFARKTMALTHRLFGIRSCNEVITGKRGRPVPRVRHQALHRAVRRHDLLARRSTDAPSSDTRLFLEGQNDELLEDAARRGCSTPPRRERFEEAAQLRDAMRTVQTLHDRQQKMATAELGQPRRLRHQARARPARSSRCSRCAAAAWSSASSSAPKRPIVGGERGARCWRPPSSSSTSCAARRRKSTCRPSPTSARRSRRWLSERAGRRCGIVVPQRGEKRGLVDLANRNAALAYQTRFNQATAAQYDALETLQPVLALPALPRRIECFDISTIQGSETVASMVVCEDGRMQRSEYRKFRIRGHGGSGAQDARAVRQPAASAPASPQPPHVHDDFAAMHEVVRRRYRKLLEQGGPFPDLIADRRRQGAAVGGLRGARGARAGESGGGRHREEGRAALHARSRGSDRAARRTTRRCC